MHIICRIFHFLANITLEICIFMRKNELFYNHFFKALVCAIGCGIHALQNAVVCKQNACGGLFQTKHLTYE